MSNLDQYTRKLAAILFTDMVGYTAVMQKDEMKAILLQKRHQATVETCVKQFGGEVKNDMGDGSMSILPSAYQVIQCAMAIQEELKKEPRVNIRIGIHIADVLIEENGKVHGDGINIASRIETLGVAGAILFSKEIHNKIRNHPEFKSVLVGSFPFKNVEEPMEIYAIGNEGYAIPSTEEALAAGKLKKENGPAEKTKTKISPWIWVLAVPLLMALIFSKQLFGSKEKPGDQMDNLQIVPQLQTWNGQVFHFDARPAGGVIIDINGGVARDTTDDQGKFLVQLPVNYAGQQITLALFYNGKLNLSHEIRLSGKEALANLKLQPEQ